MHSSLKIVEPLIGKTYSLYADLTSTDSYFQTVSQLTDELLKKYESEKSLLDFINNLSKNRRLLKKYSRGNDNSEEWKIVNTLNERLSKYTVYVTEHLRTLPLSKRFNGTMTLSREQYHLYMIIIELMNRINKNAFSQCEIKYAFLPHCMHDLSKDCLASPDDVDYACMACSKECSVNEMSRLLRKYKVKPYLLQDASLKSLFKRTMKQGKSVGAFGVACVPELVNGMHLCAKARVPVIGIPLDANRCRRWWGKFNENTVNIKELERFLQ